MDVFSEIKKLLSEKNFSKAKELAQNVENEIDKYNLLGIIFYYESKLDNAIEMFKKALNINPVHPDVLFNYSKSLFEKGDYFESWRYLTRIPEKSWEVWDMLGDTQLKLNNPAMALHYYKKAYESSNISELKEKYEHIRKHYYKGAKLAIFCLPGLDNFIHDIANILSHVYEVKLVVTTNSEEIVKAYNWADIVWLEWANEMAVEITNKLPKADKKIVCRLHRYEAFTNFIKNINWDKIDILILVANHMKRVLQKYHKEIHEKIKKKILVIDNGLDLNRFTFTVRQHGYNIVVAAYINHRKQPVEWLQIIGFLKNIDLRYQLHIAGSYQDPTLEYYFTNFISEAGLEKNVKLYGWVNDINSFLEDKNYLLSTSIHESFGYNIAEAMARGIKPIIHNYHGAKEQWPEELVYNFIYEIPNMLIGEYDSIFYRKFVEDRYSLEQQIKQLCYILSNLYEEKSVFQKNSYGYNFFTRDRQIRVIVPSKEKFHVRTENYEEDIESELESLSFVPNYVDPGVLVSDKNIEYMIDFLDNVINKSVHYKKTLYYRFLEDVYRKKLYTNSPEMIVDKFLRLYELIKQNGKILKPVVAFVNKGLEGISFHSFKKSVVPIPTDIPFLTISGRHRVAIANFLKMDSIPVYFLENSFINNEQLFRIIPTFWKYFIEENEPRYKKEIEQTYVGIFTGEYQRYMDMEKKRIVTDFVLKTAPKRIIDIGCNKGELSYQFTKYGIEVIGIDVAPRDELKVPDDYHFIQMNIAENELPITADVILFLSVYHHLVYNYGLQKADEVFYGLLEKTKYLLFDTGHPEEVGIYRQSWIKVLREHFSSEKAIFDHFSVPYKILGKWRTTQGSYRTVVVFENNKFRDGNV